MVSISTVTWWRSSLLTQVAPYLVVSGVGIRNSSPHLLGFAIPFVWIRSLRSGTLIIGLRDGEMGVDRRPFASLISLRMTLESWPPLPLELTPQNSKPPNHIIGTALEHKTKEEENRTKLFAIHSYLKLATATTYTMGGMETLPCLDGLLHVEVILEVCSGAEK